MGIHIIKMPDIGEGIAEVELVAWHVKVGDTVAEDQPLADVMTDKATVEIPSPVVGKVLALGGNVGDVMAVGGELIRLEVDGAGNQKAGAADNAVALAGSGAVSSSAADSPASVAGEQTKKSTQDSAPSAAQPPRSTGGIAGQIAASTAVGSTAAMGAATVSRHPAKSASAANDQAIVARKPGERPLASPAVRKRAWDLGIELRLVRGSAAAGRILHEDLDAYLQGRSSAVVGPVSSSFATRTDEAHVPVIGLRRKIAQKMQESKRRIPHFTYVEEIDVTELEALRVQLNRTWGNERGKLTILPFLARALVIALRDFPQLNARFDDEAGIVTRFGAVHLGIATQSDAGLMVPVLRHAETQNIWGISAEISRLAHAVRAGRAERDELSGSTITISSLGALGGIVSTPVINYPEVGIVGVNRIVERPMFREGVVVARKLMNLSSSFDHRVVDGMDAAKFIQAVRALLEQPAMLFVE